VLLEVANLDVRYGGTHAIKGLDLAVGSDELIAVLGANGAGKSSLLRAIQGLVPAAGGVVRCQARVERVLRRPDGTTSVAKRPNKHGSVTVTGEPGELVLFCFGRQQVADVQLDGDAETVERLRNASFGV